MRALEPYPSYRESGVPWLGEIPVHWEVLPNRGIFTEVNDQNHPSEQMLSITIANGIVLQDELLEDTSKKDQSRVDRTAYKLVQSGDVAYNKMRAWQGAIGVSQHRGIVSPAYIVQRPSDKIISPYAHHLLRTPAFAKEAERHSYGITSDMWSLRAEDFKVMYACVPSLTEQTAIVRFLDHVDRRIRRYIRAKEKLIALLEEQKQATIHKAITRGIDSGTTLKTTGNTWLPELPEHWVVLPMRRVIASSVDGPHHSPDYQDYGVPFLSARNIKVNRWSLEDIKFISQSDYEYFSRRVRPEIGDVLYTKGGTTGIARAVDLDYPFQVWVHVAVLKLRKARILPHYLAAALNTPRCYEQSQLLTRGATNQDLGLERMKEIMLPVPPLSEQADIVEHVAAVEDRIGRRVRAASREIDLVHEYRTRLIADVVTGKLDVRVAAAALPEVDHLADDDEANDPFDAGAAPAFDDEEARAEVVG